MNVELIGMKEFRQNMAKYTKDVQEGISTVVVMRKNKPAFKVMPIEEGEITLRELEQSVAEARARANSGTDKTLEEVMAIYGLKSRYDNKDKL